MCLIGATPILRGILLFIAQMLGAMSSSAVVSALFPGPLTAGTSLAAGTSIVQGLFIEMFLTAELLYTIFMLAAEKHRSTYLAPIGIGLALFVAELTGKSYRQSTCASTRLSRPSLGVYYTGGSLNPARSFGPAVVTHNFHGYHWIYWVGPLLGCLIAVGFYKFIKILEYETANPGQDETDERRVPNSEDSPEEVKHPREHGIGDDRPRRSRDGV